MSSGYPPSSNQPFGNPFGDDPNSRLPNPYQSPVGAGGTFAPTLMGREAALERVKWPAIALMVLAPPSILFYLFDLVMRVINWNNFAMLGPNPAPGAKEGFVGGQIACIIVEAIAILLQLLVIWGALQMLRLKNRKSAMIANIISVIPCFTACCLLGIPFGIWGIVTLNDPTVSKHFES